MLDLLSRIAVKCFKVKLCIDVLNVIFSTYSTEITSTDIIHQVEILFWF